MIHAHKTAGQISPQSPDRMRKQRHRMLLCQTTLWLLLLLVLLQPQPGQAQNEHPPYTYTVQPGDTLTAIASRFSTDARTLAHDNDIQDPRQLYPGQQLYLNIPDAHPPNTGVLHAIQWQESLLTLAHRAGQSWQEILRANQLLHPSLPAGYGLRLSPPLAASSAPPIAAGETRLTISARQQIPAWQLLRLNPVAVYAGGATLLPTDHISTPHTFPIASVSLSPQPLNRGQSAVVTVETLVPVTCEVAYLESIEPCYMQDETHAYALIGIPALLEPGHYSADIFLETADGNRTTVSLPLIVAAGRYDYERLDVPSDRQALPSATGAQAERDKIAALRPLRTMERLWEYPLRLPVEASVTSYYGSRRSYGYGFTSYHGGTDFRAQIGTPVLAPASGIVVLAEPLVVRGNAIIIDHGWGVLTGYWHLSKIEVAVGDRIAQGQRIAAIGNTGYSTGPHLHWEMWVNGTSISPLQWTDSFTAELPETP